MRGRVVDPEGAGVPGATVFVREAGGRVIDALGSLRTDAGGAFEHPGLAPGAYTFLARTAGAAAAESEPLDVHAGAAPEPLLVLAPATRLRVVPLDAGGRALRAAVQVYDAAGRSLGGLLTEEELVERFGGGGGGGREHRLGPLPPGSYRIEAVAADGRRGELAVELAGEAERVVSLTLRP